MDNISFRSIFLTPRGAFLWKALLLVGIYVALRALTQPLLGPLIELSQTRPNPPQPALIRELWAVLLVFGATWVLARIEKRSVFSYGFIDQAKFIRFAGGVVWGFIGLSVLVGMLWWHGSLSFSGFAITGTSAWRYGVAWGVMFTLVGVAEEAQLRGYLQYTLSDGTGFWWSALILSLVFALLHAGLGGETLLGLVSDFALGMTFCVSLWYTGSLYWAVGFHAGWDWSQSFFYGTPDSGMLVQGHLLASRAQGDPLWSGGITGPEGSLFALPLPFLMALAMWLWWRKIKPSGRWQQPPQVAPARA
jgi:membrane protease YdiL (CAAX protease family)